MLVVFAYLPHEPVRHFSVLSPKTNFQSQQPSAPKNRLGPTLTWVWLTDVIVSNETEWWSNIVGTRNVTSTKTNDTSMSTGPKEVTTNSLKPTIMVA